MGVPHPIPYQGSKRLLVGSILRFFPSAAGRVVEPFAGSAAISLASAYYGKATSFLINDINRPLMDLWKQIVYHPTRLASQYRRIWQAQGEDRKAFFFEVRRKFNQNPRPDYFLFLLVRCVKATIRYNSNGQFNNSPDNRRKGTHPDTMKINIERASKLLRNRTLLLCKDYRALLNDLKSSDLVYMDPPYQGVCREKNPRYVEGVNYDDFVDFLEKLNRKGIRYIVSYDGRTGDKTHGKALPDSLELRHFEIDTGRSSQATLLGKKSRTYESLYLSPSLRQNIPTVPASLPLIASRIPDIQIPLFG